MKKLITICALVCLYGCKSTTIDTDSFNMPESYYKEFYSRLSTDAYDFKVANMDDAMIYYRVKRDGIAYVAASVDKRNQYKGTVRIPAEVTYQGKTYKVEGLVSSGDIFPDNGSAINSLSPFTACQELEEVILPASIDSIGSYSFFLCSNIKTIRLPSTIKLIGECSFSYCKSLIYLCINCEEPPKIHDRSFENFSPAQCTLYVPKGCKARYQQAEGWKDFKKIVEQ